MGKRWIATTTALATLAFAIGAYADNPTTGPGQKTYEIVPNGLRCGNATFDLRELAPSIQSANETRLLRVRKLHALGVRTDAACTARWYPGCEDVDFWDSQQAIPWPEDGAASVPARVLADRMAIVSADDVLSRTAHRVLAHHHCEGIARMRVPPHDAQDECVGLLRQEVLVDSTLLGRPCDAQCALSFDDVHRFYQQLAAVPGHRKWKSATTELINTARKVPYEIPPTSSRHGFPRAGSEEEALQRNDVWCRNSDFYVGPNHEVIRRKMTVAAAEPLSVCVDTPSFATDQPISLTVSTPSQKNVYLLWPGEPRRVPMELRTEAPWEIAHLTIGGYPRGDLLRALARHTNGPLANQDAFQLLNAAAAGQTQKSQSAPRPTYDDLASFEARARKDPTLLNALAKLNDDVTKAAAPQNAIGPGTLQADMRAVIARAKSLLASPLTGAKVADSIQALLPDPTTDIAIVTPKGAIQLADRVGRFLDDLAAKTQDAKVKEPANDKNFDATADALCQLTSIVAPLVEEDVLVRGREETSARAPSVIEYDFAGGFLGWIPNGQRSQLDEDRQIFVMVRNVAAGYSVGVSIDDQAVVHRDLQLVGLSPAAQAQNLQFEPRSSTFRFSFDALDPFNFEMQPPSTQILALGTLAGGARYKLSICAVRGQSDCSSARTPTPPAASTEKAPAGSPASGADKGTAAPASKASDSAAELSGPHIIAVNSLTVHGLRRLGVRAGFGVNGMVGGFNDLVTEPGVNGSVVRHRDGQTNFSLPLLLTFYCNGRDSVGLPSRITYGPTAGLDVLKISDTPRMYLGWVHDFWGLGLTGGVSLERVNTVSNPERTVIVGTPQIDQVWRPGFFAALTTDFDIFYSVFQQVFLKPAFPSLPEGK